MVIFSNLDRAVPENFGKYRDEREPTFKINPKRSISHRSTIEKSIVYFRVGQNARDDDTNIATAENVNFDSWKI
jgi:hypothetical protein